MSDLVDVKSLREALGWNQYQLADYCGVDRSTISKWEKEAPAKGPALVLLRRLQDEVIRGAQPERPVTRNPQDADRVDLAGPVISSAGPAFSEQFPEAAE